MLGGRAAEEIFFNEVTSGAQNDIERATRLAHKYVCQYGMSPMGPRAFGRNTEQVFLGRELAQHDRDYGDKIADQIDTEINQLIDAAYNQAKTLIGSKKSKVVKIVKVLIEKENLEGKELEALLNGDLKEKILSR